MQDQNSPSGLLLIDKPVGISSFGVIRKIRKILNIRKIGHGGTLDPFASGLMILGVNKGTKLLSQFLHADKTYIGEFYFGATSTTDDPEGEISYTQNVQPFSQGELEKVLPEFIGKILQTPPVYSALKIQGKRSCDRVRSGEDMTEEMEKKTREVEIYSIKILGFDFPKVTLEVHCGGGTYIRSLARDLGEKMDTGAYLLNLRRTGIGEFTTEEAEKIEEATIDSIFLVETH